MPKIKKYQNCKNDVYQPDEKGYPQTVFSHSICLNILVLSGDRKPQIRFLGNHPSGSGNLYHKSFRM